MKLIKRNIRRVVAVMLVFLFSLIGYGAYSMLSFGNRWFASSANNYTRKIKGNVKPGEVTDRSGVLVAYSDAQGRRLFHGDAQTRRSLVHVLGDNANNVAYGIESFMANYLYGFKDSYLTRLRQVFTGQQRKGNSLRISIDSELSKISADSFPEGKSGAVVVMNYVTGELLVLQSYPNFDPMQVTQKDKDDPLKPFWNRATKGLSAPGSTFKVVTLAAALQNIPAAMTKEYLCTGAYQVGDSIVTEAGNAVHGTLNLKRALSVSCNITFAKVALSVGDEAFLKTCREFGLNDYLLFTDLIVENSRYPETNRVDKELAWTGVGQSALAVTPLHMCMIAASIGNDGVMMEPKLLLQAADAFGNETASMIPSVYHTPLSKGQADVIAENMRQVVTGGTGMAAAVPGLNVCGKTGSAQVSGQEDTNAWFIGFLDDPRYPFALCVVVENAGGGGSVAAPVARRLFSALGSLK